MSSVTKAKINLKDGTIELEGSEAFVSKHLEAFEKQMKEVKTPNPFEPVKSNINESKQGSVEVRAEKPKKKIGKTPQTVAPISLDLKTKDGKPALRDFFKEKDPKNQMENLTVFAYYLKKHLNINDMQAGHVASCCKEVNRKVPTNMISMFKNIQHRKGWLDVGTGGESVEITTQGENFVEYDLPRKEDAPKHKTAT